MFDIVTAAAKERTSLEQARGQELKTLNPELGPTVPRLEFKL